MLFCARQLLLSRTFDLGKSSMSKSENIHIAFADDHVASRVGIASFLQSLGGIYVDMQASHGKELIAQLKRCKQLPSICLLDVSMPVMNGLETLTEVKKRWPEMKFLIMSAFSSEHLVVPLIRRGAGGYLLKSCYPEEIKKALIAIHETGFYNSDFVTNHLRKEPIPLTDLEVAVLKGICSDENYAEIGKKLNKTGRSIEGHRDAMFKKFNVTSRIGLVLYAIQAGIVPIELLP